MRGFILSTIGLMGAGLGGYTLMPGGEVYALPATEVESKLRGMDLPGELGLGTSSRSDVVIEGDAGHTVVWRMRERGQTVGWVEAEMTPVDAEHTRVEVDFRMSEVGQNAKQAALINRQSFMKAVGTIAIGEAVDATLEDRAFDRQSVGRKVASYAITHPQEVALFKSDLALLDSAKPEGYDAEMSDYRAKRDAIAPEMGVATREREMERATAQAGAPMMDPTPGRAGY